LNDCLSTIPVATTASRRIGNVTEQSQVICFGPNTAWIRKNRYIHRDEEARHERSSTTATPGAAESVLPTIRPAASGCSGDDERAGSVEHINGRVCV